MTVIRGLSPLVRIKDFRFGRLQVRVQSDLRLRVKLNIFDNTTTSMEFILFTSSYGELKRIISLNMYEGFVVSYSDGLNNIVFPEYSLTKYYSYNNYTHQYISPYDVYYRPFWSFYLKEVSQALAVPVKQYDPLPDVLANLKHFGQRLEVWLETEISGGSREWRRLFRSAPAAQVSIGPLQDAGYVDEEGYIVRMPEAGAALPVYGRNALGPYSKIDQFNPSRAS